MLTNRTQTAVMELHISATVLAESGVEMKAGARLRQAPYAALRQVSCRLRDGVLTLRGRVPSYYLKQTAQALLISLDDVLQINNELDVVSIHDRLQEAKAGDWA